MYANDVKSEKRKEIVRIVRHPRADGDPEQGHWEARPGEDPHGTEHTRLLGIEVC